MTPIKLQLAFVVDLGEVVSLFGFDPETGRQTAVYVDHRPWVSALQRLRNAPSKAEAFIARGVTLSLDFGIGAEQPETVQ